MSEKLLFIVLHVLENTYYLVKGELLLQMFGVKAPIFWVISQSWSNSVLIRRFLPKLSPGDNSQGNKPWYSNINKQI